MLRKKNQQLRVTKGGEETGAWAVEILAVRYAAWIKPEFEIDVYETFVSSRVHSLDLMNQLNRIDYQIAGEKHEISQCASKMSRWGIGGRKALLNGIRRLGERANARNGGRPSKCSEGW